MKQQLPFIKMHGLGNDFIILDQRKDSVTVTESLVRKLAERRLGVGCDQLIVLQASNEADIAMVIYNADGSKVAACGNATRCVGALMLTETGRPEVSIATDAGILRAYPAGQGRVTAQLAAPKLDWQSIPLSYEIDAKALPIEAFNSTYPPVAVSVGNPHLVFWVPDVQAVELEKYGAELEHHPLFPERTNVEIVQVEAPDRLKMRVWERGAGITQACGTGACATLVASVIHGLCERKAEVKMPGGSLQIEWLPEDKGGAILMTGDACESFRGVVDLPAYFE